MNSQGVPRHATSRSDQLTLDFREGEIRKDQFAVIKSMRAIAGSERPNGWRGWAACPPGSILEIVCQAFYQETNIPVEMPWAYVMTMLSWQAVSAGSKFKVVGVKKPLDLWMTVLANSCTGKTFTQDVLSSALKIDLPNFGGPVSAAAWFDTFAESNGVAVWLRDEWGQEMKRITSSHDPLAGTRDYLLRTYDHSPIERRTVNHKETIDEPIMVILGFSVFDTWSKCVTAETLLDGLAQRFSYLVGDPDETRPMRDYPLYDVAAISSIIRPTARKFLETPLHPCYTFSAQAQQQWREWFFELASDDVPESYFRRVMWRGWQYAVLYHRLLGKKSSVVGVPAMRYAIEALKMHAHDAMRMLRLCDRSEFLAAVEQAEKWIKRRKDKGKSYTARDLLSGCRLVKDAKMARDVLAVARA